MSIKKRLGFIARSYLNDLFDGDLTEKVGKSVSGLFGSDEESAGHEDIDLDELERKYHSDFGDLGSRTTGTSSRTRTRTSTRRRPRSAKAKLAAHYKTMGLPPDTAWPKVRAQFRSLMRKYHPDRYASDPKKQAWATKKTQGISEAFAALEKALT